MIAIGIAALAAAATMLYEAHELTSSSYNYINARTCVEALKELEPNPFNESAAASITARLPISIQVVVEGVNGTQLARYGNYIPITPPKPPPAASSRPAAEWPYSAPARACTSGASTRSP